MENEIIPIIAFLFIVSIYCIAVFLKLNERVVFYEELDDGDIFNIHVEDSSNVYPLVIKQLHNYEITSYADIAFDYAKYYNVPIAIIYKIVKGCYEHNQIIKILEKYKYTE